ncbi:MAG: hybrid sensor histidine kinase/response regulator [Lentisphaerae bacterium]|nr:hybrid sensor histidine kinase/response regulator [Lentisphaerota bacterium]
MESLRVLIVDDEPGMRMGAVRVLKRHTVRLPHIDSEVSFECDVAESIAEARGKLAAGGFDLLLLDYKLPDGTGLELLREIQEQRMDLLVIMITAFASLEVAVSATRNGAFDFLSKPFAPEELESIVTKASRSLVVERAARRMAEEKRKMRLRFLSVLAHELKAPLGSVEGNLKLLDQKIMGPDLAKYEVQVKRALARIEGMRKLIFDLLDLTRIEAGERKREVKSVDLVDVARTAIETMTPDAEARRIAIRLQAPERLDLVADRSEMEIVFNNLVSNAVKYNRDGGSVDVRLARGDAGVTLEVQDTGIGMSQAEAARLFGEFVRIKNDKTRNISGSGLGLSTVRKLATLYGGDVVVRSEPDVGTTFTVTVTDQPLPAAAPAAT